MTSPRVTLTQAVGYNNLVRSVATHKNFENLLPKPKLPIVSPTELIGIEIEVEGIRRPVEHDYYWKRKQDGSLRNYGMEYASIPLAAYQIEYALNYFNESMVDKNIMSFSPRTSTHVHMNARNMTWDEVEVFVLLYAIFERHFFMQVNPAREKSIFCVPIYKTDMMERIYPINEVSYNWYKYSALNLCTLTGQGDMPAFGTIEFRHMHGTTDPKVITEWVNNIHLLKAAAMKYSKQEVYDLIKTMNTTSAYLALYVKIFGDYAKPDVMAKMDFEYCITNVKLGLYQQPGNYIAANPFYNKYKNIQKKNNNYDKYIEKAIQNFDNIDDHIPIPTITQTHPPINPWFNPMQTTTVNTATGNQHVPLTEQQLQNLLHNTIITPVNPTEVDF